MPGMFRPIPGLNNYAGVIGKMRAAISTRQGGGRRYPNGKYNACVLLWWCVCVMVCMCDGVLV